MVTTTITGGGRSVTIEPGGSMEQARDVVGGAVRDTVRRASPRLCDVSDDTRPARVPADDAFDATGFCAAPEIERIGEELRRRYEMPLTVSVAYRWKRKGGKKNGNETWGMCSLLSGVSKHFAGVEYLIWIAADHARENALTRRQLEALIHHELRHVDLEEAEDGELKPIIRGHDVEMFAEDVREYGLWHHGLDIAAAAFRQAALAL